MPPQSLKMVYNRTSRTFVPFHVNSPCNHVPGHVFNQTLMQHVYVRVGSCFFDEAIKATKMMLCRNDVMLYLEWL